MPSPLLPTTPAPASYQIRSKTTVLKSESLSGKITTRKVGGQRFEATLVYPPMNRGEFNAIHAFLTEQAGGSGIFYIKIPVFGTSAGGYGEYINYSNSTKLHMVKSDGVDVYPDQLVSGGTVEMNNVYMRCSLKNNIQEIKYSDDGTVRFEIDVEERL